MKKLLLLVPLLFVGCKSADLGQVTSLGHHFHVVCYSGNVQTLDTYSNGQPSNEDHSDGFYFTDYKSGKLIEVTGACVFSEE